MHPTGGMTMTAPGDVADIVDVDRYPLDDPGRQPWAETVGRAQAALAGDGCAVLPGVIRTDRLPTLEAQGDELTASAHHERCLVNVYNTAPDADLPADHPARITFERANAFVARDRIPPDHLVQRLYTSPGFQQLIAACFGLAEVHVLGDPLAGLTVNVVMPGADHPWHFDTNEVTVSLLTRAAEGGGHFEYCPGIRAPGRPNHAAVRDVLDGRCDRVRHLGLRAGDLQLFRGRDSLHRVTPVRGTTPRHAAIFAYADRPGIIGDPTRTRQLFGRVTAAHVTKAAR